MRINRELEQAKAQREADERRYPLGPAPDEPIAAQVESKQPASANSGTDLAVVIVEFPSSVWNLQTNLRVPVVPAEFFKPQGSDAILAQLEISVRKRANELDISTDAGRRAIASLAYQVARTKTGLDDARKALVADQKEAIKLIDKEGGRVWDRIEALQAEVRKPLTDWENADKARVEAHEAAIVGLQELAAWASDNWQRAPLDTLKDALNQNQQFARDWQEFKKRGECAHQLAAASLVDAIERREKYDSDQAELQRLRAEEAERKEAARRQEIADEAAAAERKLAAARQAEQARLADQERLRIEAERNEAAAQARQAEAERVAAEQRAERDRIEAEERHAQELRDAEARAERERVEAARAAQEQAQRAHDAMERERVESARREQERAEKAERDREAAVKAERERIEAAQAAERQKQEAEAARIRAENEAREKNRTHRRRVEGAIIDALMFRHQLTIEAARAIVVDINEGGIPGVNITY